MINKTFLTILIVFLSASFVLANGTEKEKEKFSFAFFTDIHLNKSEFEKTHGGFQGIDKAIASAKKQKVDFILTGGDNVDIDVLGKDAETAHKLYQRYAEIITNAGIDYYVSIGNHDRFFGCEETDPLHNEGMFEKYISKSYYSYDHKGWHFIVLNTSNSVVDDAQKQWLANDLAKVAPETPIMVSCHVPFLSVYYPALQGRYTNADTFSNFKEIWDMFNDKNLKLVLQGHQHLYEEINALGVQFITAGAVSASWWGGPYHGTQEGYLKVNIDGDQFYWEYVDYGWDAKARN
ncbi:metallophosphoesterase [Prolixibacteraceae bacterium Z1-6]|uniref:Metallophosphoesterase n=1 Tax=Draconibacterium aestuarii TaxID=2998507 RepID=A0A9X3J7D7_9BACT|nr:metallophosphoesterase [Prolixibacteraceae bacterium Z1-6]